jgi:DNA-binding Lrp family transcriptional regulator
LEELQAAALEICQEVEEGVAQAGSSLASRLRALRGHVSQRMRRALHLGVKKALGVVASHYQMDFEAVSSGYVVPIGVEDEEAMNRADALAATAADVLAEDFADFLFPDAPGAVLTVNSCIKVRLDLQADKSPVVVKGPFFPRVVNPRYRICVTMCNTRIRSSKARKAI